MGKEAEKMFNEIREIWSKKYNDQFDSENSNINIVPRLFEMPAVIPMPSSLPQTFGPLQVPATDVQSIIDSVIGREVKARIALKKLLLEDVGLDERDADEIIKKVFE